MHDCDIESSRSILAVLSFPTSPIPSSFAGIFCSSTPFRCGKKAHVLTTMPPRVWLITGCSSGFGRQIAIAAAKIGDTVVATSRDPSKLEDLKGVGNILPQRLDICASDGEVQGHVADILATVGRIDVVVNNAGYILEGAIEESR